MEEAELVRKMISGDKDAFAGLMEIYQKQALRAAYLISGNYADSEDIVLYILLYQPEADPGPGGL